MISSLAGDEEDFLVPMFFNSSVSSAVTMRVGACTGGGQPTRSFSRSVVCLHWLYPLTKAPSVSLSVYFKGLQET